MASTGGDVQYGAARVAIPDALNDLNRVAVGTHRPALRIVFVDSCPNRRSTRLRRVQTRAVQQTHDTLCRTEYGTLGGDEDTCARSTWFDASEDESDDDYDDEEARPTTRPRAPRNTRQPRKRKRHGKLAPADRDLLLEAQQGRLPQKRPKNKAPRIATAATIDLVACVA